MVQHEDLIKMYDKCSEGYHRVDDFRAKLLGFLPLASGVGIFGALYLEVKDTVSKETGDILSSTVTRNSVSDNFIALGALGVLATLGLLIYELKGIAKCTQFIFLGNWIESKIKESRKVDTAKISGTFYELVSGYFTELAKRRKMMSYMVSEPVASAIIY